jgi:hypothetical protein
MKAPMNLTTAVKIFLRTDGMGAKDDSAHRGINLREIYGLDLVVGAAMDGLWGGLYDCGYGSHPTMWGA